MVAGGFFDHSNLMIFPVGDEFLPTAFGHSPQTSGIDQIQELAGDWAIGQRKISATHHWNAAPGHGQPVKQVNQFDQFHDVDRAALSLEELASRLSRLRDVESEIHAGESTRFQEVFQYLVSWF